MAVTTVDEYLAGLPERSRSAVAEVRSIVHVVLPEADEVIRYGIPTFAVDGRSVVHVAGWSRHLAIYPVPGDEALAGRLAAYVSGKGTLRFPLGEPLPTDLIAEVVVALGRR